MPDNKNVSKIKRRFRKFDKNKNGSLNLDEMTTLLRKGCSDITDREIEMLFKKVDKNGNGTVEFGEFVDFVFKEDELRPASRERGERRPKRQSWDVKAETEDVSWDQLEETFQAYVGRNGTLERSEFGRLCRDCGLLDDRLGSHDVDIAFSYVCPQDKRHITPKQFQAALEIIAQKKRCPTITIRAKVAAFVERLQKEAAQKEAQQAANRPVSKQR